MCILLVIFTSITCLRYENKGVQWLKSRPVGPVGLAPDDVSQSVADRHGAGLPVGCGIPSAEAATSTDGMSKAAKKNMKRREKKKEKMSSDETHVDHLTDDINTLTLSSASVPKLTSTDDEKQKEQIRQLRALRKKLKQIVDLQARSDAGEKLEPEQLEKIGRRKAIEEEMEYLEIEITDN